MNVEESFSRANAEIDALRKTRPASPAEARRRASELVALNEALVSAAKQITDASAQKRLTNGSGAKSADDNFVVRINFLDTLMEAVGAEFKKLAARVAALEEAPVAYVDEQVGMNRRLIEIQTRKFEEQSDRQEKIIKTLEYKIKSMTQ
jgi:hypothetical protein